MNEAEEIRWLGTMVDDETLTKDEIINGFPLLQLLSLVSPASVDLGFLTTQWNSPDIDTKIDECLKNGITYLQLNIPPTFKLGLKNRQTEFTEKMDELTKTLALLDEKIYDKSESSMLILKSLHDIWISCQTIREKNEDKKPELTSQDTLIEIDELMAGTCVIEDYSPVEPTLRPMIRLIFYNAIKYLETKNSRATLQTLNTLLSKISYIDEKKIPNEVIEYICTGELYNLTAEIVLKLNPKKKDEFLDMLIENGSLNIQSHMLNSIKEMIHESVPFYESIHINIISAFISSKTKKLDVDKIVSYLDFCFLEYNRELDYPFDIEDAFLIWMQNCFKVLKSDLKFDYEFEDLTRDLDGGWLLVLVITKYFNIGFDLQKLSCKPYLSYEEKSLNHQILENVVGKCNNGLYLCWEAIDMVSEREKDGKYVSPGNISYLFLNFLFDLFQIVSAENIRFGTDEKTTEKLKDTQINSNQESLDEMEILTPNSSKLSQITLQDKIEKDSPNPKHFLDIGSDAKKPKSALCDEIISIELARAKSNVVKEPKELKMNIKDKTKSLNIKSKNQNELKGADLGSPIAENIGLQPIQRMTGAKITSNEVLTAKEEIADFYLPEPSIDAIKTMHIKDEINTDSSIDNMNNLNPTNISEEANQNAETEQDNQKEIKTAKAISSIVDGDKNLSNGLKISKTIDGFNNDMIIPPKPLEHQRQKFKSQFIQDLIEEEQELIYIAKNDQFANIRLNSKNRSRNAKSSPSIPSLPEIIHAKNEKNIRSSDKTAFESKIEFPELISPRIAKDNSVKHNVLVKITSPTVVSTIKPSHIPKKLIGRRKSDVHSVINGLEDELETLNLKVERKSDLNRTESQKSKDESRDMSDDNSGKIIISETARAYFGNSDTESEDNSLNEVLNNINSDSSSDEESDLEVEQSTLNLIKRIKESRESTQLKTDLSNYEHRDNNRNNTPFDLASSNPLLSVAHLSLEQLNSLGPTQTLAHAEFADTDSILDLYDTPEPEKRQIVSRPQTGLLTYPLPDPSNFEPMNDIITQPSPQLPKSAKKKQEQLNTRVEEAKQKKIDKIALQKEKAFQQKLLNERKTKERNLKVHIPTINKVPIKPKINAPKSTTKSNRIIIKNALMHVCLAGSLNFETKTLVIKELCESDCNHFVILFRDVNNFSFRGLYSWDSSLDQTLKLYSGCAGPTEIDPRAVLVYYKYDSGARTFKEVPTKTFGRSIDAVAIGREYYVPPSA